MLPLLLAWSTSLCIHTVDRLNKPCEKKNDAATTCWAFVLFCFTAEVSSVVSPQCKLINEGMPVRTSNTPKPSTQPENVDKGAANTAQHCPFDTICRDAVRFSGLFSVFSEFYLRITFGQSYFSKPHRSITSAIDLRVVLSKMKHGSGARTWSLSGALRPVGWERADEFRHDSPLGALFRRAIYPAPVSNLL